MKDETMVTTLDFIVNVMRKLLKGMVFLGEGSFLWGGITFMFLKRTFLAAGWRIDGVRLG